MASEETIIDWTMINWITVFGMVVVGFLILSVFIAIFTKITSGSAGGASGG